MKVTKLEKLATEFADRVAAQTECLERGEHGNRHARRMIRIFEILRAVGDEGRDALVPLLDSPRRDVRVKVAALLLRHRTERCLAVLREIARGDDMPAFGAGEALKRWDEGTWQLDPP
jgi:hypothetical protein